MANSDYRLGDLVLELVYQGKQVAGMVVPVGWEVLDGRLLDGNKNRTYGRSQELIH